MNFALAIAHFDPRLSQPQPPGYPLFVGLLKVANSFFHDPNRSLILSGLIGSAAGLALVWVWGFRMFGMRAAWSGVALLLFHPAFWVAGIVNPVRSFLVVIAAATAASSWMCMTRDNPQRWFFVTSITLGLLSGFRPESVLLLSPLWLAAGLSRRFALSTWILGLILLALSSAVWIAPLVWRMGGLQATYLGFYDYLRANSVNYAVAFGAHAQASAATMRRASVWNFGLTIAWIWALPFAWRPLRNAWSRAHTICLACAFLPAFFFHAFIHVRDVDQTLISIPALCVLGGAVMGSLRPRTAWFAALAVAVLISAWNFRRPMFPEMAAASRGAIRYVGDWTRSTFAALNEVRFSPGATFIWNDSVVTWRQVSYYYPANQLLVLSTDPPLWVRSNQGTPADVRDGAVVVAGAKLLVLGVSYEQAQKLRTLPGARLMGPLVLLPWEPADELKIGSHVLRGRP